MSRYRPDVTVPGEEPQRSLPLVAIVLAIAVLGVNARIVVGGKTWDDARYHTEVAPPRLAAADAVQSGVLPAWWEGSGLGVPLASEPSHGAMYPLGWVASTPRGLDWLALVHLWWAALGVAVWARRRASEPASLVAGLLVASTGILASAAVRGALPALAHLPWIAISALALRDASGRSQARVATIALGLLVGLVGLAGSFAILVDALVLAFVLGARRETSRWLALGLGTGLAIAAAQWVPAFLHLATPHAGGEAHGLPLARLLELIVPGSFGAKDPDRALVALAGEGGWAPSVYVGAALLALAAVRVPERRALGVIGVFTILALVVGRGGWPVWTGAPELHLAALVLVLGAHAGVGIDAFVAGERRAVLAIAAGAACTVIALGALGALRGSTGSTSIDSALVHGGIGVACLAIALALAWRAPKRMVPVVLALLVLPSLGPAPAIAPVVDRERVEEPPTFAGAAYTAPPRDGPRRVYRPQFMFDAVRERAQVFLPRGPQPEVARVGGLGDLLDTLAGTSAAKWGLGAARSEDPARSPDYDLASDKSASEGGALLDRYGIAYAILPATTVIPRKFRELARRGDWSLVWLDVAPAASTMRGWAWAVAPADGFDLLFARGGGVGVLRGTTVLRGGGPSQLDRGPPLPCMIDRWEPGDIALVCTTDVDGYAVVSSASAPGWRVTVDDGDAEWLTADVLRRAVPIRAGTHRVSWSYHAPGLRTGMLVAALAFALLVALALARTRAR